MLIKELLLDNSTLLYKSGYKMKKSVVIACFNSENFIEELIDSLLFQTEQLDELIFIDDGSQDKTAQTIRRFADQNATASFDVRLYINEFNTGTSNALNSGIHLASGDVVFLTGHDDVWIPSRVAEAMEVHRRGVNLFHSAMEVIGSRSAISHSIGCPHLLGTKMLSGNNICGPSVSVLFNRDLPKPFFYFNPNYDLAEDYDLWCRLMLAGVSVAYSEDCLVKYRSHDKSVSVQRGSDQRQIAEKVRTFFCRSVFPDLPKSLSPTLGLVFGSQLFQTKKFSDEERSILRKVLLSLQAARFPAPISLIREVIEARILSILPR